MKSKLLIIFSSLFLISINAFAQYPEDALRLAEGGYGVSAKSVAMGNAMIGLAQGFDATYFNPAGLAQSRQSQVQMGLNFLGYTDNSTYLGNSNSLSSSQTDLSSLGLVYPFPTTRGSFVIAFGYNHGPDYNAALAVSGYNPNSSIIPSLYYPGDTLADIAYMDFLENTSQQPYINGNVNQSGNVYVSGGLSNWLASAGLDIAPDFSLGLTINLISGQYKYVQNFQENGVSGNNYNSTYFTSFALKNEDNQSISGWNAKLGMMYRVLDSGGNTIARFGATVEFPTLLTVNDNFSSNGTASFAAGPLGPAGSYSYATSNGYGENESPYPGPTLQYDVTTPFKLGFGVSGGTPQLQAAADIQYVDWTELSFSNFNLPSNQSPAGDLNGQIKQQYRPTTSIRAGVEYALTNPNYSLLVPYLRAGVGYLPSPYSGDGSAQAQKLVSGGLGVKIQNTIEIDVAYQYDYWNTTSQLYPSTVINGITYASQSTSNEKITNTNFLFTFKYDF